MSGSEARILFLDIDDTLLTRDKRVTEENDRAIRRAVEAGHRVVLCSGRPHPATIRVAEQIGLAGPGFYAISYNGGQIYDCGRRESIFRNTISLDDVRMLFREADSFGFHIQTYDSGSMIVRAMTREAEFYESAIRIPVRIVPELPDGLTEEPVKVLMIDLDETGVLDRYRERIFAAAGDRLSLFMSNRWYLECVPKGISKGFAVKWLCDYLGIPVERSVAAGDSENDLEMIRTAGTGCAMANACAALKETAGYITERDCDESGVAEVIDKFILS